MLQDDVAVVISMLEKLCICRHIRACAGNTGSLLCSPAGCGESRDVPMSAVGSLLLLNTNCTTTTLEQVPVPDDMMEQATMAKDVTRHIKVSDRKLCTLSA